MKQPPSPTRIIFFDIDQTLYIKQRGEIPLSVIEQVLPRLKAAGIQTAIATGRCLGSLPEALKPLLPQFDLLVTLNGQANFYRGKLISRYALTAERIEAVLPSLQQLGLVYAFVSDEQVALSAYSPAAHAAIAPIKADYLIAPDFYRTEPIMQLLAFYPESLDAVVNTPALLGDDLRTIRWHEEAVDIIAKANSKAKGIADSLAYLGLPMSSAMAFGDGLNDKEMFQAVGFSVAMGNAEAELKPLADFVTKGIEEDGILYALETLGII